MPRFPRYFRNSRDGRRGLAVLSSLLFVLQLAGPTFGGAVKLTVTRTDDQLDSSPGDGLCIALNGGGCALRAAVQEANALAGPDGIYPLRGPILSLSMGRARISRRAATSTS